MPNNIKKILESLRESVDYTAPNQKVKNISVEKVLDATTKVYSNNNFKPKTDDKVKYSHFNEAIEKYKERLNFLKIKENSPIMNRFVSLVNLWEIDRNKYEKAKREYEDYYRINANKDRIRLHPVVSTSEETDFSIWHRTIREIENRILSVESILEFYEEDDPDAIPYKDELDTLKSKLDAFKNENSKETFLLILNERIKNYQPDLLDVDKRDDFFEHIELINEYNELMNNDLSAIDDLVFSAEIMYKDRFSLKEVISKIIEEREKTNTQQVKRKETKNKH